MAVAAPKGSSLITSMMIVTAPNGKGAQRTRLSYEGSSDVHDPDNSEFPVRPLGKGCG